MAVINLIIKMEILPYYWTPWLSIWCHQNMTNPSQKSHPAWLKKWLMAFPNCTSMAIPLAQKEVLYEKIMSNFSKTSVWKEKLQFTAFFYNCKIFSDREIYILGCDLCIYITIKNMCTWSLNYFVVVIFGFRHFWVVHGIQQAIKNFE